MPAAILAALLLGPAAGPPAVVVNEVFYHAPDDLDRVQWVELHNPGAQPVTLGGWTLNRGKLLAVPAGTTLPAGGFLVFALDPAEFAKAYGDEVKPAGSLARPLKRGGDRLELRDAGGALVDVARYDDRAPWPVSADGRAASLERICPAAPGDAADNWAGSPLPAAARPAGTPGQRNSAYSATPPPAVAVEDGPASASPGRPLAVAARVTGDVQEVVLLYRAVTPAKVSAEVAVPMASSAGGRWQADIPGQLAGTLLRYRVRASGRDGATRLAPAPHDLRPTLSSYVHDPFGSAPLGRGVLLVGGPDRAAPPEVGPNRDRGARDGPAPPRGASAFVYADPAGGAVQVFDHITAAPRVQQPDTGHVLHFHKDRPFRGMTAASLFFESHDRLVLDEALSYDLFRRAGNAAPLTEFVRVTVDGQPVGHRLLVERPNKSFLRRNGVDPNGHLYKVIWQGEGLAGTHLNKTHPRAGHADLKAFVDLMARTRDRPAEQWAAIRERVDVDQAATFFAVNMVVAYWDGYFNNHFAYHDTKRGKWQFYPWDHDQAWGAGGGDNELPLTEMPLTFGMEGAAPPGNDPNRFPGWWRPGGEFSKPLLANPHFRPLFLARVRTILDEWFTEAVYGPVIDDLVARLGDDARQQGDPGRAGGLANEAAELKKFLVKRRAFLLAQPELTR